MPTCNYCQGDHRTSACPQKAQNQTTEAIEKIGYMQLSEINKLATVYRDSATEISSSIERISDRISHSVTELTTYLEYSHAETMWLMERQLEVLTGIKNLLEYPRATEANELLKMGAESLKRGMVQECLNLLQEAVKLNPLDYRIYITMGHAYLAKDDYKNAFDRFEYSLKNARRNSYKINSLLLMSHVCYSTGDIRKAIEITELATQIHPDCSEAQDLLAEAHYQCALYRAQNRQQRLIRR